MAAGVDHHGPFLGRLRHVLVTADGPEGPRATFTFQVFAHADLRLTAVRVITRRSMADPAAGEFDRCLGGCSAGGSMTVFALLELVGELYSVDVVRCPAWKRWTIGRLRRLEQSGVPADPAHSGPTPEGDGPPTTGDCLK